MDGKIGRVRPGESKSALRESTEDVTGVVELRQIWGVQNEQKLAHVRFICRADVTRGTSRAWVAKHVRVCCNGAKNGPTPKDVEVT